MLLDPRWLNKNSTRSNKPSLKQLAMSSVSALSRSALIASKTPFRSRPPSQTSEIFAKLIATLGLTRFFRRRAAVLRRHARRAREAIIHNQQRRQQRAQRRKQQLLAQGGASGLHALEPRMVFDAAAAVTAENAADQVAQQQASDAQSADAPPPTENKATADAELTAAADNIPTASDRNEIAFIDSSVQDIAELLSGIDPSTEIIMLSPNEDGVEQIAAALEGRENIDAIHLLSHGEQGRIFLGNDVLDTASMQGEHLDDLTAIRSSLSAEGDILIYGCDFTSGEAGLEAAMLLGSITGADIAASSDATGSADLGGDWDLETNVGTVETDKINAAEYNGLLAPLSVTPVGTGGVDATTLAQQIVGTDVSIVSATLGGANSQAGTFSGATGYNPAWLAFDNGVVLSSGTATSLTASNTADGDFLNMGQPGTADFDAVGGGTSFDASYIDIKFVPNNDRIALEFVFGSDEYNEYVYASVNDAIGIWVDGTNIALNPTGDPIGIDTINQAADFNPGSGSQANDPNPANGVYDSSAPALYVNNDINDGGPVYSTSMDGFTRTLGANITVTPGVETTIRIGIADIGDGVWSSWLLIRGDSFQSNLIAENDAVGTTVDTPVTFSPTANDVDFDDDAISIINIADQPITAGNSVVLASGGTVLLNNDNTLTYTPPAGSTAPELFTYTITDSNGNTATAYVTVNVVSGAAPTLDLDASAAGTGFATSYSAGGTPVAIADIDTSVVDTDSSIASATIGISSSFAGDQLAAGSLPAGITVDTASSSATSIVLTGNASPADYAAAIEAITFSNSDANPDTTDRQVAVQITDTQGLSSNLAQATISISANQSPTAVNDTFSTDDATSVTIDVIGGPGADSDPDGDSLTVTHVDGNAITDGGPGVAVTGGTVTLVSGELVFTPSGAGSPSFTYTIDDGKGGTDQATVTGTVTPSNLPPVANDSTSSGDEDNDIPIALTGTDSDGSIATVSVTSLPPASEGILYYAGGTLPVSTSTPLTAAEAADLVFTPAENFHGTVTVSFTVTDDDGASSGSANEVITVNPVNDDPTAVDNDYTACEDDTASVIGNALTDNDSGVDADPDGDDLELIAASNVAGTAGGLFSVTTNGQVTFDPNGDFEHLADGETLTTSYTYTLTDNEGGTDTATISVEVTGANDRPVIVDPVTGLPVPGVIDPTTGLPTDPTTGDPIEPIADQSVNDADGPISIDVGALVADPDTSDVLDFNATGLPTGLSIDPDSGEITGTIDNSASQGGPLGDGVYPVTVTVTDPHGAAVTMTFTYTVANPAPTAVDNDYTAGEDDAASLIGNALTDNDSGVDADPDGDDLELIAASNVAGTAGGLFSVTTNGQVTFDPNGDFEHLADGETLTTSYTYTLTDNEGGTDTATISVEVTGANDRPVIVDPVTGLPVPGVIEPTTGLPTDPTTGDPIEPIADQSVNDADGPISIDVGALVADPDTSDVLDFNATGLPTGLSIDPDSGEITGTIDNSASQGGPLGNGVYPVTVTATDPHGAAVTMTFTYTVANPAPTAVDNDYTAGEDDAASLIGNALTDNDSGVDADPDGDDLELIAASNVAGTAGGLFSVTTNGQVTFDPNGDFEHLADGETLTTSYTYTLTDNEGGTDTATISVEVTGANDRPVIVDPVTGLPVPGVIDPTTGLPTDPTTGDPIEPIADQSVNDADGPISIDVGALVADPDTSDVLDFNATGLPTGLSIDPDSGEITGTIDNSASQGGPLGDGVYPVTVTVTDPHGAAVTMTFTYTVANPAPTAVDNDYTAGEDDAASLIGNALTDNDGGVDADPDGDDLELIAASNVAGTAGGLFSVTTNGQVTFDPNGDFEHLADGETLTTSYTYTLTDNEGGTDTATISVEVTGVNVAPIAQPHENTTPERTAVSGQLTATDIDGGELRYTIADRPQNGQATVNPDGSYTYVPAEGFQGVDTFTVQVDDGHGGKVSLVVTINVTPNPGAGFEQFLPVELRDGLPGPFKLSADFFSGDNNDLSQSGGIGELPGDNTELTQNGIILDTVNGIEDLGGIGAVTGSILASTDPDRLDQLARQATQTFGSSAGFWNSQSLTGFSLRAEISGIPAAGDATRNGQIIVDTIIKDRIIYIEMSNDLNHSQHGPVTEYAIKQADGRPLPDWAKQAQNGLLLAEPPPGQKVLETEIVAVLEDGTSITHRVAIQLASGEVRLIGQSDAPHAPTFQQQIDDAARTGADEIRDLGQSVITNPSQ